MVKEGEKEGHKQIKKTLDGSPILRKKTIWDILSWPAATQISLNTQLCHCHIYLLLMQD